MGDSAVDTPVLLAAWRGGDLGARDALITRFYPELRSAAAVMLRRERGVSFSTRDLIHEAVARLVVLKQIRWEDRTHFLALASTMMRRTLIDHARSKRRRKRDAEITLLHTGDAAIPDIEVIALSDALSRLAEIAPDRAEIVEMRFFGGMELTEIALVLGCSESTVKRRWNAARLWLLDALVKEE